MKTFLFLSTFVLTVFWQQLAHAESDSRIPTHAEFLQIKSDFAHRYQLNLSHVVVRYNLVKGKGPVWATRLHDLGRCYIGVNPGEFGTANVEATLSGAPNADLAKKFLVAHELGHCLFDKTDTEKNLQALGFTAMDSSKAQETLSDLVALAYVFDTYGDSSGHTALSWIKRHRSWNFFAPRYNTSDLLTLENIQTVQAAIAAETKTLYFFQSAKLLKPIPSDQNRPQS